MTMMTLTQVPYGHQLQAWIVMNALVAKRDLALSDPSFVGGIPRKSQRDKFNQLLAALGHPRALNPRERHPVPDESAATMVSKLAERLKAQPDNPAGCDTEVQQALGRVCVLELTAQHVTGKEAIELAELEDRLAALEAQMLADSGRARGGK